MELLLFRHSEFERIYNCSSIHGGNIGQNEKKAHPFLGISLLILASIYQVKYLKNFHHKNILPFFQLLYIPCLYSLHKLSHENSCYKFLFFIGIIDVMAILMCGFLTGIFGIFGIEFCTFPTFNYIAGAYGLGRIIKIFTQIHPILLALWIAESGAEWLLAVNRSLEMIAPKISRQFFDGPSPPFIQIFFNPFCRGKSLSFLDFGHLPLCRCHFPVHHSNLLQCHSFHLAIQSIY